MTDKIALQDVATRVIAKAWSDAEFKARLLADPAAVAAAEGIALPAGLTLKVHENGGGVLHLVLPEKPSDQLSDTELDSLVGGGPTEYDAMLGLNG